MSLPAFRYHPDPISTGSIKPSDNQCICCGKQRGYIYTCTTYSAEEVVEALCPWCIADGSAATRFDAEFSDGHPLAKAGVPSAVIEEVTRRTPGYISWQQDEWLCCCGDACEFHGDASRAHVAAITGPPLDELLKRTRGKREQWERLIQHYQPGGSPAIYHFICRHCGQPKYGLDFD
jgi:uncharacterized protein CbrC (UPF0167 family)